MELKILIKQTQQVNIAQQQIYYFGANPNTLNVAFGSIPANRQWQKFGQFIDVTSDVSDPYRIKLTWTMDRDSAGEATPGMFNSKKTASGSISFEGEAYRLIKQWLVDDVSAPLNSVDVKIQHVGCGYYENWQIKAKDLRWCEDGDQQCVFDLVIKQKDEELNCIKRTLITDNHIGWFPEQYPTTPAGGKKHPRFSYCNEIRPNGILTALWHFGGAIWALMAVLFLVANAVINVIIAIIKAIVFIINLVISFINTLGANLNKLPSPNFIDPGDIFDDFATKFIESAGCGREHPAPLIKDYIYNVCKKCGIDTNSLPVTAPLFFSDTLAVETSMEGAVVKQNPHSKDCYFNAPIKRGIRRFESLNIFGSSPKNTKDYWIPENAPLLTLDMFLDKLKGVYNMEWRITDNKLHIHRKDFFQYGSPVLDFVANPADKLLLLEGICFEWTMTKQPATCQGLYNNDATDVCGNEAMQPMNGPMVVFGQTDKNPNFEGILDKSVQFGATKFRLDGASTDYVCDAMQVVVNGALSLIAAAFKAFVAPAFEEYADYALLLKDETAQLPKILTWDGNSYENAKVVRPHSGYPIDPANGPAMPTINGYYNNYPSPTPWHIRHQAQTFVIGSSLSFGPKPPGYYKVQGLFGGVIVEQPALLCNYPMYFEPGYQNTLWDWFHWIDDPVKNPRLNMGFTAKVELCCPMLERLKVLGDGSGVVLGQKIKVPGKWFINGVIKEITVSYDPSDMLGQFIEIKGEV